MGKNFLALLVVGAALIGVAGLARWAILTQKAPAPEGGEPPLVNVEVQVVQPLPRLLDTFEVPAVVEANRVVTVSAEVAGRIEKINCKEGEVCRAWRQNGNGSPLAELKPPPPLIELNTELLQAELDRAAATSELAVDDYNRIAKLAAQGGTTKQTLAKFRAAMRSAKAEADLAHARLRRARIYAPIPGVLNDLLVEDGEYVQIGTRIAEIVDIDTVKVAAPVPELDVPFLKVGDAAVVVATLRGERQELPSTITYISETADTGTRATRIELTLDNRKRLLRSGQIVRVRLTRRVLTDVVMVPLSAVIPMETTNAAYVVEWEKVKVRRNGEPKQLRRQVARRRDVKVDTGLIKASGPLEDGGDPGGREQRIRVVSGLGAGDRLIVAGHQLVAPGQPVRVQRETRFDPKRENRPRP